MRRIVDAGELNAVINHPAVRSAFGYAELGELDTEPMLADERNVCLTRDGAILWFTWRGPGMFEVHCVIGSRSRGAAAVRAARDMIAAMTDDHGAKQMWCEFAADRRDVALFGAAVGFRTISGAKPRHTLMEYP